MRTKILKLLREIEKNGLKDNLQISSMGYGLGPHSSSEECEEYYRDLERDILLRNDYEKPLYGNDVNQEVREFMAFPNYRFIIKKLTDINPLQLSGNSIRAELKRMELDGLIAINIQKSQEYDIIQDGDFSIHLRGTAREVDTESVVLTTKGKSKLGYFLYQAEEQRFAVWALFISFVSLIISVLMNVNNFN